ncbi:MAG: helix-hairpin-helix domain-containing protein [Methyloprofundus sp.]|nr:helix-hairpin-helix domain-containing protein [Methyloprofundus sp.]MBW6453350.1 helix-hairpin-helix domain-containing protein [Methyloprofundus sp.]
MKKLLWALLLVSFNIFAVPVDINKASAQEISESLDGVGLKKAEAIVAYRTANGPFASIDDLANVKGIGEKTVAKNKDNLQISSDKKGKDKSAANIEKKKK